MSIKSVKCLTNLTLVCPDLFKHLFPGNSFYQFDLFLFIGYAIISENIMKP